MAGISQFHSHMVAKLKMLAASETTTKILKDRKSLFLFIVLPSPLFEFVVYRLQPSSQVEHGVMLSREQGIHAEPRFHREFFEALTLDFVGNEYIALFFR